MRIMGWVLLGFSLAAGIVAFFKISSLTESLSAGLFTRGTPDTGLAVLVMLMTWVIGMVATTVIMVFAAMSEDVSRLTTRPESQE